MAQLKEDEWPEPGEETTQEREVRLRPHGADEEPHDRRAASTTAPEPAGPPRTGSTRRERHPNQGDSRG